MQDQRPHKACVSGCPDHVTLQRWESSGVIGHLLTGAGPYVVAGGMCLVLQGSEEQPSVSHPRLWLQMGEDRSPGPLRTWEALIPPG